MIKHIWSLVFFTVLAQMSAGAYFIFNADIFRLISLEGLNPIPISKSELLILLVIMIFSMAISFTHLGKPGNSVFALSNLKKSWLSKEIYFMSIFAFVLFLQTIFFDWLQFHNSLYSLLRTLGVFFSVMFFLSMIKVYKLKTVVLWKSAYTILSFIISTFLSGLILFTTIRLFNSEQNIELLTLLILVLLIIQSGILQFYSKNFKSGSLYVKFIYLLATILSFGLLFQFFSSPWIFILLAILTLFGIILERYLFYSSYKSIGV